MNHQILSPYTAFVGVETSGPKINNTHSKVRHIPIQITKDDEHLFTQRASSYLRYSGGGGYGMGPVPMHAAMAPMPMMGMSGQHGGYYKSRIGS